MIWDPENRATEMQPELEMIQSKPVLEIIRGRDDLVVPSDDAQLKASYPNPFK